MLSTFADIAVIVLPVFGMVAIGYGAAKVGLVTDKASDGLAEYVFSLALPVLIFKTLSEAKLPHAQPWGYWISYFAGAFLVFALAMLAARKLFGRGHQESVIHGFAAGQANTVFVGVPLILRAYGEEGAVPLFLLIAIHLPVMMIAATLLLEGSAGFSRAMLLRLVKALALNPILIGIYAGALGRVVGIQVGGVPKQIMDMLSASATPCALIALGLSLKHYGIRGDVRPAALISFLKLLGHPFAVLLLTLIFPMPPVWAGVAVLFAAMPSGINGYLLAQRYGVAVGTATSAVSLSTGLAVITIAFWLYVLGVG
ncbi:MULTISPECIES: AEC family transporter [unclassified Xanthobacter]|uniref:AEC family transporter n=1 Tax=unclassified Xanthobacter TaxID=2623496 RepID=UPI001EDFA311|nr:MULTISPECIES: AEC family transporter [unclassified Xanthobacter]